MVVAAVRVPRKLAEHRLAVILGLGVGAKKAGRQGAAAAPGLPEDRATALALGVVEGSPSLSVVILRNVVTYTITRIILREVSRLSL